MFRQIEPKHIALVKVRSCCLGPHKEIFHLRILMTDAVYCSALEQRLLNQARLATY